MPRVMTKQELATHVVSNTKNIEVVDTFRDDHVECVVARFDDKKVEFWWCGWELVAAINYANDSEKARNDVIKFLADEIETVADIAQDYKAGGVELDANDVAKLELFELTAESAIEHYAPKNQH